MHETMRRTSGIPFRDMKDPSLMSCCIYRRSTTDGISDRLYVSTNILGRDNNLLQREAHAKGAWPCRCAIATGKRASLRCRTVAPFQEVLHTLFHLPQSKIVLIVKNY